MNEFSFSELYDVTLKATYPIEIGGRTVQVGEVIAAFDKIQISNFNEVKTHVSAKGGYGNPGLIFWDKTKELQVSFNQGIFSKTQMALLINASLASLDAASTVIAKREKLETDASGVITTSKSMTTPIFVHDGKTGESITHTVIDNKHLQISGAFRDVIVDYYETYTGSKSIFTIGRTLTDGFLHFEGKTRVKDDITGHTETGIIDIPKLKLLSDLSMRLGKNATPVSGTFSGVAYPSGERGKEKVMELTLLGDDIDSDM